MSGLPEPSARPALNGLFPVDGAIPLDLQIGRAAAAEHIAERAVDGEIILVIEPRRVGKSSTIARGALPRAHERFGAMTSSTDLRLGDVRDELTFAAALRDAALASSASGTPSLEQRREIETITDRYSVAARAGNAPDLVDQDGRPRSELRLADLRSCSPSLSDVLLALEIEAHLIERPVIVFVDEVQDLGDADRWGGDGLKIQHDLERATRRPGRMVAFIFAGSDQAAMTRVFAKGQPLHHEGERYLLPAIESSETAAPLMRLWSRGSSGTATVILCGRCRSAVARLDLPAQSRPRRSTTAWWTPASRRHESIRRGTTADERDAGGSIDRSSRRCRP
jgi:hypothetical protein